MSNCVILTTINAPSGIIDDWIAPDRELIVVGDQKTPEGYADLKLTYLDLTTQSTRYEAFSAALPFNHYARKNIGYVHAIHEGFTQIAETDDDTIPLPGWPMLPQQSAVKLVTQPQYPNIYKLYSKGHIWPRGFPLDLVNTQEPIETVDYLESDVCVWQGLVNDDPDVDAIYRLTSPEYGQAGFTFQNAGAYALSPGVLCAFNTQNTVWTDPRAFPYLYLPSTVSFRATDIVKSYVAQHCIWALGGHVGFYGPTARQERNAHNLLKDFESEVVLYVQFYAMMAALSAVRYSGAPQDLYLAYEALCQIGLTEPRELGIVEEWLRLVTEP